MLGPTSKLQNAYEFVYIYICSVQLIFRYLLTYCYLIVQLFKHIQTPIHINYVYIRLHKALIVTYFLCLQAQVTIIIASLASHTNKHVLSAIFYLDYLINRYTDAHTNYSTSVNHCIINMQLIYFLSLFHIIRNTIQEFCNDWLIYLAREIFTISIITPETILSSFTLAN